MSELSNHTTKKAAAKARRMRQAALGFRVHSGWAALVAVAGTSDSPTVIDRRRIVIADPAIPGSKQPYHAAEGWPLAKAEEYLGRCTQRTNSLARQAVNATLLSVEEQGHRAISCGLLTASGRPVTSLQEALSSHAMLHTAEGEFFRNAVAEACSGFGIPVTRIKEKELFACAAKNPRATVAQLQKRVLELGQPLGPPWSQDEKFAALAAWVVLAAAARPSPRPKAKN